MVSSSAAPRFGTGASGLTKEVAGRDVGHDQEAGEVDTLGSLARTLTAEHYHPQAEQHCWVVLPVAAVESAHTETPRLRGSAT